VWSRIEFYPWPLHIRRMALTPKGSRFTCIHGRRDTRISTPHGLGEFVQAERVGVNGSITAPFLNRP
jgi:hypothetical protein